VKEKRFVRNLVAVKFEIAKTETTVVGPPAVSHYFVPAWVGSSESNCHPVGTAGTRHRLCVLYWSFV